MNCCVILNFWTLYKVRGIYSIEFKTKSETGVSMLLSLLPWNCADFSEFRFEILTAARVVILFFQAML
jgi:hypothetical protein